MSTNLTDNRLNGTGRGASGLSPLGPAVAKRASGQSKRTAPSTAPRAARLVLRLLAGLESGSLSLHTPDGIEHHFGAGTQDHLSASISINDWSVFKDSVKSGDVGFAQAYIDGRWSTPDVVSVLNLLVANRHRLEQTVYGNAIGRLVFRLKHLLNHNSKEGARRNIHAHYDLGNEFYALWLDPGMTYSSALGLSRRGKADHPQHLQQAQQAKFDRVLEQLAVRPGEHVLEIGCGWGGFAHTAMRKGLHITGITLSAEQLDYAQKRLQLMDSSGTARADLRLQDYRDVHQSFDGIASIEMFEAVGERYWNDYFTCLQRNLKAGRRAVIQTIVIRDDLFERYRRGSDFIQQYVFPGGMLPSPKRFEQLALAHGFVLHDRLSFGADYAATLALWRARFMEQLNQVRQLPVRASSFDQFDERFVRLWEFYLAYCEAAFTHGNTDVCQYTLVRKA